MNKKLLAVAALIAVGLLVGGLIYIQGRNQEEPRTGIAEENIPEISAEELGLIFTLRSDKKAGKFTINNVDDIELVEYQISYTKEIGGEKVSEGLIGEARRKPGEKTLGIDYREFGTCSSGVCRYDKVVSDIKLILKITKSDGKVYSSQTTAKLK